MKTARRRMATSRRARPRWRAFAKSWRRSRIARGGASNQHPALLERQDYALVAWYRALTHLAREGRMTVTIGRRELLAALGGAAIAWPLAARAQQAGKVYRVGMLETTSAALNAANLDALREGLRQLGYVEGQNLVVEYRSADGRPGHFSDLAAELIRLNVDVIVTRGTPAAIAAKKASNTIPIVMAASGEPLGSGLIVSLARPGGNVTGLSSLASDTYTKRVALLREIVPAVARILVLLNMSNPVLAGEWRVIQKATSSLGIQPQLSDIRVREDIERAFNTASGQRDALVVGNDTLTQSNRRLVVELAAEHRLPAIYAAREFVDAGGLIAYGVSYPDLYRRAAAYINKILKGVKPADLPVEQPSKFELVISVKTAHALGLAVPPTLLALADEVIE